MLATLPVAVAVGAVAVAAWNIVSLFRSDADLTLTKLGISVPKSAFSSKVIWITGASSGIGKAMAIKFSSLGAIVVLSARNRAALESVAVDCRTAGATGVLVLPLDVCALATHASAVETIVSKFGRLDILVNNAGQTQRCLAENGTAEMDATIFQLNVFGPINLTRAVLPLFFKNGGGHIVTISSAAGKLGSPVSSTYSASKHAINGFMDALRTEVFDRNVHITVVCPGPVQSNIVENAATGDANGRSNLVSADREDHAHKMSAERCADWIAAATFHRVPECWISMQPILFFLYMTQYFPTFAKTIGLKVARKRVEAFRTGSGESMHFRGKWWKIW